MSKTKVSIIVPVYGVEQYLARCLDSLIRQSLEQIEIIVINDCSQDGSDAIIQHYALKDNRIISVCNDRNVGQGLSRKKGLELASGKFVAFVDADDYVELNMYEELYLKATSYNYDVVGSNLNYVFPDGTIYINEIDLKDISTVDGNYILNKLFEFENSNFIPSSMCDKIYRISFLKKKGISMVSEREYFLEDLLFNIDVFINQPKTGWMSKGYYNYLIRSGSTMYSYRINFVSRYMAMYDRLRMIIISRHLDDRFIRSLNFYLFTTTFAFVSNSFLAPINVCKRMQSLFLILKNRRLKENFCKYSIKDVPFHSNKKLTKLCKRAVFIILKYF